MAGPPKGGASDPYRVFAPINNIIGQEHTVYTALDGAGGVGTEQQLRWVEALARHHQGHKPRLSGQSITMAWKRAEAKVPAAERVVANYGRIKHIAYKANVPVPWWERIEPLLR